MIDQKLIEQLVETFIQEQGRASLYLVSCVVAPSNQITIELADDEGLSIDLCVQLNKVIESNLDREQEDFELEVGSAGLTSPFKVLRQYQGAIGKDIEVLIKGGKKEEGQLKAVTDQDITITVKRRVKPEGAKRKIEVEEDLVLAYEDLLQCKRIIKI